MKQPSHEDNNSLDIDKNNASRASDIPEVQTPLTGKDADSGLEETPDGPSSSEASTSGINPDSAQRESGPKPWWEVGTNVSAASMSASSPGQRESDASVDPHFIDATETSSTSAPGTAKSVPFDLRMLWPGLAAFKRQPPHPVPVEIQKAFMCFMAVAVLTGVSFILNLVGTALELDQGPGEGSDTLLVQLFLGTILAVGAAHLRLGNKAAKIAITIFGFIQGLLMAILTAFLLGLAAVIATAGVAFDGGLELLTGVALFAVLALSTAAILALIVTGLVYMYKSQSGQYTDPNQPDSDMITTIRKLGRAFRPDSGADQAAADGYVATPNEFGVRSRADETADYNEKPAGPKISSRLDRRLESFLRNITAYRTAPTSKHWTIFGLVFALLIVGAIFLPLILTYKPLPRHPATLAPDRDQAAPAEFTYEKGSYTVSVNGCAFVPQVTPASQVPQGFPPDSQQRLDQGSALIRLASDRGPLVIRIDRSLAPCNAQNILNITALRLYDSGSCTFTESKSRDGAVFGCKTGRPLLGFTTMGEPPAGLRPAGVDKALIPRGTVYMLPSKDRRGASESFGIVTQDAIVPKPVAQSISIVGTATAATMFMLDQASSLSADAAIHFNSGSICTGSTEDADGPGSSCSR